MKPLNNCKNYTGLKFGRLTVLEYAGRHENTSITLWKCVCVCGGFKIASSSNLRAGYTKSCGCLTHEPRVFRHGSCVNYKCEPLYRMWIHIKGRCYNKRNVNYRNYGQRGVYLFKDWIQDYVAFKTYIINTLGEPKEGLTLDRIDGNSSYIPGNLRWATRIEQNLNRDKLRTRLCTSKYKGVCLSKRSRKWVAQIGVNYKNINLGEFEIEEQAAQAYNNAAVKYFGKDAKLNII